MCAVKFLRLEDFLDDLQRGMVVHLEPQGILFAEVTWIKGKERRETSERGTQARNKTKKMEKQTRRFADSIVMFSRSGCKTALPDLREVIEKT